MEGYSLRVSGLYATSAVCWLFSLLPLSLYYIFYCYYVHPRVDQHVPRVPMSRASLGQSLQATDVPADNPKITGLVIFGIHHDITAPETALSV